MQPLLKTVFHVHTNYSDDSNASIEGVFETALAQGVRCVAITDHDAIEGARELAATAGPELRVIVGEEISTAHGHLIGLFLRAFVEPGMSVRVTAEAIREQGGLVVVPHPFNRFFDCGLRERLYDILDLIDVVEVSNAQNLLSSPNRQAIAFARRHGLPSIVGSDTHHRGYLDSCCQWLEPFDGPQTFLHALRHAHFFAARHPLSYFARTANVLLRHRLLRNPPTAYGQRCTRSRRPTPAPVPVEAR